MDERDDGELMARQQQHHRMLSHFLSEAYRANVMGSSPPAPLVAYAQSHPDFLDFVRAEHARLASMPSQRCFASAQHVKALTEIMRLSRMGE